MRRKVEHINHLKLKNKNMSNEIVKMPFADMLQIGKVFSESGMFSDAKSAAQAIVKIQAGQEVGVPPFAAMSGIHIIQGKPVLGAGLIASIVKGSGKYDYKVVEMSDKNCSIDFFQGAVKIGNSTFNLEDAKRAGTTNLSKFPKNMLFARAISNGVKWYCPDVFAGSVYVPGEIEDIPHEVITQPAPVDAAKPALKAKGFNDAITRIRNGEDIASKLIDTFALTAEQLAELATVMPVAIVEPA